MGIQQRQSNRAAMDPLYNSLSIALPSQHARMQLNCPGHALLCLLSAEFKSFWNGFAFAAEANLPNCNGKTTLYADVSLFLKT
jgi:hypothetical protein